MRLVYGMAALLAAAAVLSAQEKCQTVRGVLQAYFDPSLRAWVNEIHAVVDDSKMITGKMTMKTPSTTTIDRGIGFDRDGVQTWDFGEDGTLTVEVPVGLHLRPAPGPEGFGVYWAMGMIVDGTGGFAQATGTVIHEGPWVLWFVTPGDRTTAQGRWNAQITMRVCKAKDKDNEKQ
jgi:hypothetical protein